MTQTKHAGAHPTPAVQKGDLEIRLLSAVKHDGLHYPAGAVVTWPRAAAELLIAGGDAVEPGAGADTDLPDPDAPPGPPGPDAPAPPADPERTERTEPAQRRAALIRAMAALEPGHPDHWTRGGKPEVRALAQITGLRDIRAAERDAAWEAAQAAEGGRAETGAETGRETGRDTT
ncbi:hypothetical protein [Ruegeria sp.]|uniref:hypothetical protein n=1 Tax=Ruegeria sp. TaxID=1879320 RepID=UPI003B00CE26